MLPNVSYIFEIFIGLAIIAFTIYIWKAFNKEKFSTFIFNRMIIIIAVSGVVMAVSANLTNRLFHFIGGTPWEKTSGITYLAGFMLGMVCYIILFLVILKSERKKTLYYINVFIPGVALAHGIGRIGCFLAGCCFGKVTNSFLGVAFPIKSPAFYYLTNTLGLSEAEALITKVYPTQLFEALFCFILFAALLLVKKHRINIYLISYGTFRFLIEFLRNDDRGKLLLLNISPSQLLSIICVIIGIFLFVLELVIIPKYNAKRHNPE